MWISGLICENIFDRVLSLRQHVSYTSKSCRFHIRNISSIRKSRTLMGLHWLPVDKRIEYKLLLYTYKALHCVAPSYLSELVVPYVPRRVLRSAESNLLTVPPGKPGKIGSKRFVRASANLWNSLRGDRAAWLKNSLTVKSFKRNLKTYLFCERFLSSAVLLISSNVYHRIVFVSLYVIICLLEWITQAL